MTGLEMKLILNQYCEAVGLAEEDLERKINRAALIYGSTLVSCRQIYEASVDNAWKELRLATAQAREKYDEGVKHEAKEN